MAKRVSGRNLKASWPYTVGELAQKLCVSERTVRAMIARGMPAMTSRRPILVLGHHAKDFLEKAKQSAKRPLKPDQLYCLSCKTVTKPYGMMVDLIIPNNAAPRIIGLCEQCGGTCSRVISRKAISTLGQFFDVSTAGQAQPKGYTEDQFKTTLQKVKR